MSWSRGDTCRVRPGAGYAEGAVVTVLQVVSADEVKIAYGDVTSLTVFAADLVGLPATARGSDPWTSHAAARSQVPERLSEAKRRILHALAEAGTSGLTDFDLERLTGRKQTSFGVRRGELVKAGLVAHRGEVRPSDTNSPSKVWVITDLGLAVWSELGRGAA